MVNRRIFLEVPGLSVTFFCKSIYDLEWRDISLNQLLEERT
jgi:hypothetical protein